MLIRGRPTRRRGALMVESAVVYPLLFLLLFGLIVGGLGVFRFQQVACQAREAARWASVRGAKWARETGKASPSAAQVRSEAVLPLAQGMDPGRLTVQVHWVDQVTGTAHDWDLASKAPAGMTAAGAPVTNRVRVTITYQWSPEALGIGPLNLRSISEIPMAF